MRIAFDATPLMVPTGGIPRYVVELRRALEQTHPSDRYHFLSDQKVARHPTWPSHWEGTVPPLSPVEKRWWVAGLPLTLRRLGIDVFHGTDFAVPYVPVCASVLSLHDLSPWMDPSWHHGADRVRQRTPLLLRLGLATIVLTLSEAVRRQAMDRFRLQSERIISVPLAAGPQFRPVPKDPSVPPYFLYVGTLEPRKNLPFLVEAWREVWKRHRIPLVLAGRRRADGPEFAPEEGLRLLGAVDEEALPSLYSNALAVVYPTLYEGFGLPLLEAMQCGAAVLTSRDPSVVEVTGDAAWQGHTDDSRPWVEAMCACITHPEQVQKWRAAGVARAAQFTWRRTAERTHEVYVEANKRFFFRRAFPGGPASASRLQ